MVAENQNASELYAQARERMDAKEYEAAIALFEQSASVSAHFKTLELLGECYCILGKYESAIIPLAAASALNSQARAPALLANAFYHLGEHSEANRFAKLALERGPGNRLALEVLSRPPKDEQTDA